MDGDEITNSHTSMPQWPEGMPVWQRVLCVLGYHKRETRTGTVRRTAGGTPCKPYTMKLRDQCGRCGQLL